MRSTKALEQQEIIKLRKHFGLPPIKTGNRNCLRCGIEFFSEDLRNQFNCYHCRREENISIPKIERSEENDKE